MSDVMLVCMYVCMFCVAHRMETSLPSILLLTSRLNV